MIVNMAHFKKVLLVYFTNISRLLVLVLLVCSIHNNIGVSAQWSYEDDTCYTPDNEEGSCIPVRQCEPIISLINRLPRPLNSQAIQFIQRYKCGYQSQTIQVCCPSRAIHFAQQVTNRPSRPTRPPPQVSDSNENGGQGYPLPPDVTNHRNRRLLPTDCGVLNTDNRIVNGERAGLFEFPWMALLSYRTSRGPDFRCGGSIINNRYILTAAHCISNLQIPLIGVRVGEYDIYKEIDCVTRRNGENICAARYQDLKVVRSLAHPLYNSSAFINDIGLVEVTPMNMSVDSVQPVCLPFDDLRYYNFTGRYGIVTGWGATETGRASSVLMKVEIPFIDMLVCQRTYQSQVPITYKQLCAGGRNRKDSCGGDSGGPLHVVGNLYDDPRYIQQGIVSFGPRNCGLEGNPGVYTHVAYYLDWILDTIGSY